MKCRRLARCTGVTRAPFAARPPSSVPENPRSERCRGRACWRSRPRPRGGRLPMRGYSGAWSTVCWRAPRSLRPFTASASLSVIHRHRSDLFQHVAGFRRHRRNHVQHRCRCDFRGLADTILIVGADSLYSGLSPDLALRAMTESRDQQYEMPFGIPVANREQNPQDSSGSLPTARSQPRSSLDSDALS